MLLSEYGCPQDGATLARVSVGEFWKGGGDVSFEYGSLAIRLSDQDIEWWDFMEHLNGDDDAADSN